MNSETRHPCPCCGYRTYLLPADGTTQLCPVCYWEDLPEDARSQWIQPSLPEGQRNFSQVGSCERRYRNAVRLPDPDEARSPHWLSWDDFHRKLIDEIEQAFADVSLDGGITLHQMDVLDDLWGEEQAMREAALKDPETRWQDISPEKLSAFARSLTFLDPKGFRFHLPAFMQHALITSQPDPSKTDADGVISALQNGTEDTFYQERISLLTPVQLGCAAAFLHYFANIGDTSLARDARKGLEKGWDQWMPEFVRLSFL